MPGVPTDRTDGKDRSRDDAYPPARRVWPVVWYAGYLAVLAAPVGVLLAVSGAGFWWDASMALGYGGLAVMGLQFILTARFRRATAPFGIDIIYYFHRWVAVGGLLLLIAHWGVLRARFPEALGSLAPWEAPWTLTAGRLALLLFGGLVVTSLWRKALHLEYDFWRATHVVLALVAIVLSAVHMRVGGAFTNSAAMRWLWAGYAVAWLGAVAYVRVLRPAVLLQQPYRVAEVRPERGTAWTLVLEPDGHSGMSFAPGQFAWLTLRASPYHPFEHPFSFAGSAEDVPRLRFTIKALGDFTRGIGETAVGETAYVDGPHGLFTVDRHPGAPGFGFVAGGVGIAPIMSMLRTLADRGDPRPMRLIYANRDWDGVLFREELDELAGRLSLAVTHVLEEPPEGWEGERGRIGPALVHREVEAGAQGAIWFLCGPEAMSDAVQVWLRRQGVPMRRIHSELFDMV